MRKSALQPRSRKTPRGGRMMAKMILMMSLRRSQYQNPAMIKGCCKEWIEIIHAMQSAKRSSGLLRSLPSSERHCVWLFTACCSKLLRFGFDRYVGRISQGFARSATSVWVGWQLSGREWYLWNKAVCSSDLISQWRSSWRKPARQVGPSFCAGDSVFSDQGTTLQNRLFATIIITNARCKLPTLNQG